MDWTTWTMWGVGAATLFTVLAHITLGAMKRARLISSRTRSVWRRRARLVYGLGLLASVTLPFLIAQSPGLGASLALGIASFAIASGTDDAASELFETS